jgi:hypothetical protein
MQPVSFKDFTTSKATSKAKKASAKGFGAAPAKQATSSAAAAAVELTDEQLEAVLACNAYGDDHLDGVLTYCRREQQRSLIGEQVLH